MDSLSDKSAFHNEWTPEEISNQNFRGRAFGYSRKEVRDFLRLISKVWGRMMDHQKALNEKIQTLENEVAGWRKKEQEIANRAQAAEAEAASVREAARVAAEKLMEETEHKAETIRNRTENWLEEVIAQVEETQRRKSNFLTAFRSALDSHYELIRSEEDREEPLTQGLAEALRSKPTEPRAPANA